MTEQPILLNNRYKLEARQGSGGMAMVYRARDLMLERPVAIKILRQSYSKDPDFRERFRLEAKAAANLSHPNIATIHDFGLDSDLLFIVMEYVPGSDLKTILKQLGRFSSQEAIDLMAQACAGIGYAHRAGLVHCDIKPQNIIVTPENKVKVVDFGIARAISTAIRDERVDIVWGSPQYFSPEQAAGNIPTPASDVYSLGIVLFEMVTGQVPFTADSSEDLARLHQEALPPSPRKFNPEIPLALEKTILKVLAKEPSARYRTADQLGRVLSSINSQPVDNNASATILPTVPPPASFHQPLPAQPLTSGDFPPRDLSSNFPPADIRQDHIIRVSKSQSKFDWLTWILLLLAVLAAGGLIPFWLWIIFLLNPPS